MKLRSISIIIIFRWLWIILACLLVLFIISKNIYTARTLTYNLDFAHSLNQNYRGWYPETRAVFDDNVLLITGQPIYLKVYLPAKFDTMSIVGSWSTASTTVKLGLKQEDDTWFYKDMDLQDWSANFSLQGAKIYRNQIELIISIPDYQSDQMLYLDNNWQLVFKR